MALDELVELCEPTQVRHVMAVIEPQFQRDFISLLPKEVSLQKNDGWNLLNNNAQASFENHVLQVLKFDL